MQKLGITSSGIMQKMWEIANTPPEFLNHSYAAPLRALEILGRWIRLELRMTPDQAMNMFRDRTLKDNLFFAQHGYFPEDASEENEDLDGKSNGNLGKSSKN